MPFVIIDLEDRQPYIKRSFRTEAEAQGELAGLLRFFPEEHFWRRRLAVRETSLAVEAFPETVSRSTEICADCGRPRRTNTRRMPLRNAPRYCWRSYLGEAISPEEAVDDCRVIAEAKTGTKRAEK